MVPRRLTCPWWNPLLMHKCSSQTLRLHSFHTRGLQRIRVEKRQYLASYYVLDTYIPQNVNERRKALITSNILFCSCFHPNIPPRLQNGRRFRPSEEEPLLLIGYPTMKTKWDIQKTFLSKINLFLATNIQCARPNLSGWAFFSENCIYLK